MIPLDPVANVEAGYQIIIYDVQRHQTRSVDFVLEQLAKASKDDWIIFDVDEVLITLKDSFLRPCAGHVSDIVFSSIFSPISDPEKSELFGEWISQVEVELISEKLRDGIKALKEKG